VVSLIEQELNGADNLLYFESQSSLGSATITATFAPAPTRTWPRSMCRTA
jgi:multidrug efflux pump